MSLTPAEKIEFRTRCAQNPVFFISQVVPHWFGSRPDRITGKYPAPDVPWFHRGILAMLWRQVEWLDGDPELPYIMENFLYVHEGKEYPIFTFSPTGRLQMDLTRFTQIRMPRGYSKTSLLRAKVLHSVLETLSRFIVYISFAEGHAEDQLDIIKTEIETSAVIHGVWGNLKPPMGAGVWRDGQVDFLSGVHLRAKGRGAQVRGLNVGAVRPDFIILDDVENREAVATEEQRKKTREWLYNDVIPALNIMSETDPIFILGTLLHAEALLVTVESDPRWTCLKFGTTRRGDPQRGSLWPATIPMIETQFQSAQKVDQLGAYYMEYEGQIRNDAIANFKSTYFRWGELTKGEPLASAVALDPAISERKTADFAAIVAVSMGLRSGQIWVRKAWARRGATPRELVDEYFSTYLWLASEGNSVIAGIEAIAYQAALIHLMREEMFRKGQYFEIQKVTHATSVNKETRIRGILQPRYAAGVITHEKAFPELESQLKDFPLGKKDIPDALAMAIALLDPYAAAAADPEFDLGAPEYEPLELEHAYSA